MMIKQTLSVLALTVCLLITSACTTTLANAESEKVVKVFILAGQSNMVGAGELTSNRNEGKGTLEYLATQKDSPKKYRSLKNDKGEWREREDVQIWFLTRHGNLKPGFGGSEKTIGPELGFGQVVGDHHKQPVLLIKIAWGGKSLGVDFRPPSAGGETGKFYHELVNNTKAVMKDVTKYFPQYKDHKLELVGLGWHQGWNDRVNQKLNDAYLQNMTHFINDIRKEFKSPKLPFVIAETGMSGHEEKHPRALSLMKAQADVAKLPQFKGNVKFVGTKDFYRHEDQSPSRQAYHWNRNAETYYLIGEAMGKAMLELTTPPKK